MTEWIAQRRLSQILEVCGRCCLFMQVRSSLRPGRSVLERQNAELEAELLQMHTNVGQLTARLDASQSLCNELQRALVDSMQPQVSLCKASRLIDIY